MEEKDKKIEMIFAKLKSKLGEDSEEADLLSQLEAEVAPMPSEEEALADDDMMDEEDMDMEAELMEESEDDDIALDTEDMESVEEDADMMDEDLMALEEDMEEEELPPMPKKKK